MRGSVAALVLALIFLAGCSPAPTPTEPEAPAAPAAPATDLSEVVGSWGGTIHAQGAALEVVFHVTEAAGGGIEATLDSVTQGATGIPIEEAGYRGGRLLLEAKSILGVLDVNLQDDGTLKGQWNQAGQSFPLDLERR